MVIIFTESFITFENKIKGDYYGRQSSENGSTQSRY
jgi:hypothetical protein